MNEGKLCKDVVALSDRVSDKQGETYDAVSLDAIKDLFEDVKKDFGLDRLIFSKEQMEKQLNDGSLTQVEKAFVMLSLKLIKWFGD